MVLMSAKVYLSLVQLHASQIPFLWTLFSRPEHHLKDAFLLYYDSPRFWKIELSVLRDHDDDFRLYFIDPLCLSPTVNTAWLLEGDVNTLGEIVAGLFIYAATTLRLIIDRDALSPQRQLKDVLYSLMKASQTEP